MPTNTSRGTAIELGPLPNSLSEDMGAGNPAPPVYYKFTPATDQVISVKVSGPNDAGGFIPWVNVYQDAEVSPYLFLTLLDLGVAWAPSPMEVPCYAGHVYYFEIKPTEGISPFTSYNITISGFPPPVVSAPIGSFAVPDDTPGFPLAILDGTSGVTLQFNESFPAVSAQRGVAELPDGTLLVFGLDVNSNITLTIRNANLSVRFNVTLSFPLGAITAVASNRVDKFYILGLTNFGTHTYSLTTVDPITGLQGGTTYTFIVLGNTITLLGIAPDNSIAYLIQTLGNQPVKRFDIIGGVLTTNLVAGRANYAAHDILILTNGIIIVGYQKGLAPKDSDIKFYDTSGTTLLTKDFGSSEIVDTLGYAANDPISVWARLYQTTSTNYNGFSKYRNIKVSDGSILQTIPASGLITDFSNGVFADAFGPGVNSVSNFGQSFSCPFWLTTTASSSTGAISGPTPRITAVNTSNMQPGGGTVSGASLFGGIYYIKPNKTNDTIYTGMTSSTGGTTSGTGGTSSFYGATAVVAIPNPFVIL